MINAPGPLDHNQAKHFLLCQAKMEGGMADEQILMMHQYLELFKYVINLMLNMYKVELEAHIPLSSLKAFSKRLRVFLISVATISHLFVAF